MADELIQLLTRFRREIVDEIDRKADERDRSLRDYMNGHFDAIYKRLDRLESEYYLLVAAVARIEKRLAADEISRLEARHEVEELKARIAQLEQRVEQLEAEIKSEPT